MRKLGEKLNNYTWEIKRISAFTKMHEIATVRFCTTTSGNE